MPRLCAFQKPDYNLYYVFNAEGNRMSIPFNPAEPDYSQWMDATRLNTLTQEQLNKISGYDLLLYSDIEDDVYNVDIKNYDVLQTTDESHFMLSGYAYISKMAFVNTSTTCHVIFSFDGRKSWWYYNSTEGKWIKTYLDVIYTDRSNTVAQANAFTQAILDLMFKKHCTLDFAIAINNTEYFGGLTLTLPPNQGPKIISLEIKKNATTHKQKIGIYAKVDDMEGDKVSYKILRSWTDPNNKNNKVVDQLVEKGDLDPNRIEFNFNLDPADFEIGTNTLKFVFTDEKGASSTQSLEIEKINDDAILTASRQGDQLTYSAIDTDVDDVDGGFMRIRISYTKTIKEKDAQGKETTRTEYNEHIITSGIVTEREDITVPAGENEGWTDHIPGPIDFTETIQIPWETIEFGVINTITVEYKEDIYNASIKSITIPFTGTYFGLLFVDHLNWPYRTDGITGQPNTGSPNKPNELFYFSNSLGQSLKPLDLENTVHTQISMRHEIGLINVTNNTIPKATIKGFTNKTQNYKVCVSKTEGFEHSNLDEITFYNIPPFNPEASDTGLQVFYVRLFSLDKTNWEIDDNVTVSTADSLTIEVDNNPEPEEEPIINPEPTSEESTD